MKLTPEYAWSEDIIALCKEQNDLFLQLDGALSMQVNDAWLEPFLRELYVWLTVRIALEQAVLPPARRVGTFVVQLRGDDMLEGMCVANEQMMHLSKPTEAYFLKHVRPPWQLICATKEL